MVYKIFFHKNILGIMLLKTSKPKINKNLISDNDGIGLFIRDNSYGYIYENIVIINLKIYINIL